VNDNIDGIVEKIFIVGLPRTGTTSICVALLEAGYRVAHTAYTVDCISYAQVIADTPVFCDYQQLAEQFPHAKFIYLARNHQSWIPSIQQLLQRMHLNITRKDGGFNPTLKRCFQHVFAPLTLENIASEKFLQQCYFRHKQSVEECFSTEPERLLVLDLSEYNSYKKMSEFLGIAIKEGKFERVNVAGKITYWNSVKNALKIPANFTFHKNRKAVEK
jgi:hypothetical protein